MRNVSLLIVALLLGCSSAAQERARTGSSSAERFRIGDFEIVLEETLLADVQVRFGGVVQDSGDAGGSMNWLCYQLQDGRRTVELGASELYAGAVVTQFSLSALGEAEGCTSLDLALGDVEIEQGLRLGMPVAELRERWRHLEQRGDTIFSVNVGDTAIAGPAGDMERFDVTRAVMVVLRNGRAALIQFSKATTS